ncbi:MAG: Aromatic/aminoadipate aminotransferase 1 [Cirrosporium novae-zelandiae]|nr:MAG: Aromatic/aminoadipate aminotransferase 1 [Cirrosporium novae-zelandiae]
MAPPSAIDIVPVTDTESIIIEKPLSVGNVAARRAKAAALNTAVAPFANSDMFKGVSSQGKPLAKRWDHRISEECKARNPSSLKAAAKYLVKPDVISLGGGLPSSSYFPFESISAQVPTVPKFSEAEMLESSQTITVGKYDCAQGKGVYDLSVALNYGQCMGSPQLLRFVTEHTEIIHNPPYRDWQCSLTVGSTSSLDMALRIFTQRGDHVLVESYAFSSALETMHPLGLHPVGISMDAEGIIPSDLDDILSNWDPAAHNGAQKPFLLYTVPTGQNPTGSTQSVPRRKAIYAVAQKHDLYILEDEPYYFLQMQPYTSTPEPPAPPPTHSTFLKSLIPSYLSIDTDGRVMRLDSFSKVVAPGSRIGWITASAQICERAVRHCEVSMQFPSGLSQILLYKLLDESWGHSGYLDWLIHLRLQYTARRNNLVRACEAYLPADVASWTPPAAGMFHWIHIDFKKHPSLKENPERDILELEHEIFETAVECGTLVSKGSWFRADKGGVVKDMFFRVTFAAAPEEKVAIAIQRFGDALRKSFGLEEK